MAQNIVGNARQRNPQQTGNQGRVTQRVQVSSAQLGAVLMKQAKLAGTGCTLIEAAGYNASGSLRYVMFFDTDADTVPNGTAPTLVIPLLGGIEDLFSWCFEWDFQNGCVIGSSSTEATFTETGAADLFFAAELEIDT